MLDEQAESSAYGSLKAQAHPQPCRARIARVEPGSPADRAGLTGGMVITHVEDVPLRDLIEWRWQADGYDVELTLEDGRFAYVDRELGEDWGIVFDDCIFDGVITCRNACTCLLYTSRCV